VRLADAQGGAIDLLRDINLIWRVSPAPILSTWSMTKHYLPSWEPTIGRDRGEFKVRRKVWTHVNVVQMTLYLGVRHCHTSGDYRALGWR